METMGHDMYSVVADTTRAVQVKMILIRRKEREIGINLLGERGTKH